MRAIIPYSVVSFSGAARTTHALTRPYVKDGRWFDPQNTVTNRGGVLCHDDDLVAMAGLWETVEWLYAAIGGGEAGAAFLGSQGDEWIAQKDILCDPFGAICSAGMFLSFGRKERRHQ